MKQIGPYEIIGDLPPGGMAKVYKALQPSLNRVVALKVLPDQLEADTNAVTRFRREALIAAKFKHENIVTIYEASTKVPPYYIAMEYLEGGDLKDRIQGGPMPPKEVVSIAEKVCGAIDYIHKQGYVHRDIKPSNILFDEGKPVLTDFGIAFNPEGTIFDSEGAKLGTPDYMSPEQAKGLEVDKRSDLYSIAVVVYEMLTGRPPFKNADPLVTMRQIVDDPIPSLQTFKHDAIPPGFTTVLLKALDKNLEKRYASGKEFATALRGALPQRPQPSGPPPLPSPPSLKWVKDRVVGIALSVVVAAIIDLSISKFLPPSHRKSGAPAVPPKVAQPTAGGNGMKLTALPKVAQKNEKDTGTPSSSPAPDLIVPNLYNMNVDQAKRALKEHGFKYRSDTDAKDFDDTVPQGYVMYQNLRPGERHSANTPVRVQLSLGKKVKVPDLRGREKGKAVSELNTRGLKPRTYEVFSNSRIGYVFKTDPRRDAGVAQGTEVKVYVSKGKKPPPKNRPKYGTCTKCGRRRIVRPYGLQILCSECLKKESGR